MARINRRPSANRRSIMPAETAESFGPEVNDPFDPSSAGFVDRMEDPSFRAKMEEHWMSMAPPAATASSGPTSFSPGGGVPSGGPDTGIAKIMELSKPGALAPTVMPPGVAGVKTSGMKSPFERKYGRAPGPLEPGYSGRDPTSSFADPGAIGGFG
jgi:hypothetical protein